MDVNMGGRFYTEGNAMIDEDELAEMQYQMMMDGQDDDNEELLDSSSDNWQNEDYQYSHHQRLYTHENKNHDRDLLETKKTKSVKRDNQSDHEVNHWQYKGIYFNEEVGDNEKNHWEITGAHFKYEDACKKLLNIIEKTKQEEAKEKIAKSNASKDRKQNKITEIAKVKILLNYNKANNVVVNAKPSSVNSKSHLHQQMVFIYSWYKNCIFTNNKNRQYQVALQEKRKES